MTALMTSIVAIVLFGMMLVATVSYGDSLGFMSTVDASQLAARLQSAAAMVGQVQHDTGSRPTSVDELVQAGLPSPIMNDGSTMQMQCSDERCSPMSLCLSLPASSDDVAAATSAAARVRGSVSGACGDSAAPVADQVVVTLSV